MRGSRKNCLAPSAFPFRSTSGAEQLTQLSLLLDERLGPASEEDILELSELSYTATWCERQVVFSASHQAEIDTRSLYCGELSTNRDSCVVVEITRASIYIYIYIYIIKSRWQHEIFWLSLSLSHSLFHRSWQVFLAGSCIHTELMYVKLC